MHKPLFFLILFLSLTGGADPTTSNVADLKLQLKNIKESLYQAENTPGLKGLEQVKYYQNQIDKIEEELEQLGVSPSAPAQNNLPWVDFEDEEKIHYQSYHLKEAKKNPLHDNANEILNIDEKLNWLLQNKDAGSLDPDKVLLQMQSLIKQREALIQSRKDLREDPTTSIVGYKAKEQDQAFQQDLMSKDPVYIGMLEEQLQQVYTQIFLLRHQILQENEGEKIKSLGQNISQLERQETELKKRLKALGHHPKPPRIINPSYQRRLKQGTKVENTYTQKILEYMAELRRKVIDIKQKIAQAGTGNEITNLGQKLTLLSQQLKMAEEDLPPAMREVEQKTNPTDPTSEPSAAQTDAHASDMAPVSSQPDSISTRIQKIQNQTLWSDIPETADADAQIPVHSPDIYNATALSRQVDATSLQEVEQAKVLQSIERI